ncbi:MAG: shikimate kinase [Actinobacteria bacterium]|nr:shikimate kinase [Actinomycetota bacterium]
MSPVIVLVGAPGAGKTSIGRALAVALGIDFADTDELLETAEGRSVSDVFIDDGEDYFRARERETVAKAMAVQDGVLALGGGAVLADESRELLAGTPTVWLRLAPDTAVKRVGLNAARPMLLGGVRSQLIGLLKERTPLYEQVATITLDVDELDIDAAVAAIAEELGQSVTPTPDTHTPATLEGSGEL